MPKNPDPTLKLTTTKGVTRTLDDWSTMFHLCIVILPPRPQASAFIPIAGGSSPCSVTPIATLRCASPATSSSPAACSATPKTKYLSFVDPDAAFVQSLGLTHLPALVHLRQDTTLVASAEGWDPDEWQRVVKEVAKSMAWTYPEVARAGDPPPTPGWPV